MTQYDCKQLQLTSKGIYTCQTTANDRKRLQLPQKAYKYDRKQPKMTAHELKNSLHSIYIGNMAIVQL